MKPARLPLLVCLFVGCTPLAPPADDSPDPAIEFNATLLAVADAEDGFLTLKGVRAAALLHTSMYQALSSGPADGRRHAAIAAAWRVASREYPGDSERFAAIAERHGVRVDDEPTAAVRRGIDIADDWLERRSADRHDGEASYQWHPMGPGVYAEFSEHSDTPRGFVFGAGWAAAQPFALPSADFFRAPPPPDIASDAYAQAFAEVKRVGHVDGEHRTDDQTHLALWWKDFAERSHNRLARELVAKHEFGLVDASRLFARLNVAIFDAYVNVFENKFFFNHWRPYTAIRWADNDGNDATEVDPDWNNTHGHTYAFPSYPSAHGTACAAAMTVLESAFGSSYGFTMTTPFVDSAGPFSPPLAMDPPTRSFPSFDAAAFECALSRIYLGIHFRYDSVEGYRLGRRIGRYVVGRFP